MLPRAFASIGVFAAALIMPNDEGRSATSAECKEGENVVFELILPIWKQRNALRDASWEIFVTRNGCHFCHFVANKGSDSRFLVSGSEQACG